MLPDENGSLRAYRSSVADVVPLDRETERQLTYLWRAGNKAAGAKLVTACLTARLKPDAGKKEEQL